MESRRAGRSAGSTRVFPVNLPGQRDDSEGERRSRDDPPAALSLAQYMPAEEGADQDADLARRCDVTDGAGAKRDQDQDVGQRTQRGDADHAGAMITPQRRDAGAVAERG